MKINTKYTCQNFTSRNPAIRFADDIMRRVNTTYPRSSYTKLVKSPYAKKFKRALNEVGGRVVELRTLSNIELSENQTPLKTVKAIIEWTKELKAGNCGESAELAALGARTNGLKNIRLGKIISNTRQSLDHSVLVIEDKKPIIIDPWLGFADYVPNALQKYQNEFRFFFSELKKGEKAVLASDKKMNLDFFNKLKEVPIKELQRNFPELIVGK